MTAATKLLEEYERAKATTEPYTCLIVDETLGHRARMEYSRLFAHPQREHLYADDVYEATNDTDGWRMTALGLFGEIWDEQNRTHG